MELLPLLNRTIKLVHKAAFINPQEIFAITSNCRENNRVTICERRYLVEISDDPCEAALLREQHGQCHISEKPQSTEIRMINPGTLLVITVSQDVTINSTCGINTRTLNGTFLITFHNCSLYARNELYENFELRFYQPTILPLQPMKIKAVQIDRHFNISELHELNIQNRQHLETINFKRRLGFASIGTIIIFILAFLGLGIYKYQQLTKPGHCSGRAILMGDVVKHENNTSSINENSAALAQPMHGNTEIAKTTITKWDTSGSNAAQNTCTNMDLDLDIRSTGGPSLLGARSSHLGTKAVQLGA